MELDPIERNGTKFARLFGLAKEPKKLRDPLVLTEETTAWDIYNHRAAEVDREQIKDWNDSLNTLLIFAALYSAILTAFIIESAKLLEEDPAKTTRDILLVISKQLANNTVPAFAQAKYAVPEYATIVNALLFSSLSCALSTALLAVLALQWVANYDRGLSTSSAQKRALHRQMRLRGIESWKMGELIAILPLTIFLSLFLFFIGIAYWLWHVQRTPSKIVIGGMSVAALLYAITTIISTIYIEAPFRSSVSKGMAVLLRQIIAWPDSLVITSSINDIKLTDGKLGSFDLSWLSACTSSLRSVYSFIWLLPREFLLRIWSHLQRWRIAYNGAPLSSKHFENYEEMILEGNNGVAMDSLLWLASSVEISLQSRKVLLILVRSLMELPPDLLMDIEKTRNIAWEPIFTILCAPFLGKWGISQFTPNELKEATFVCQALSILSTGINSPEFQAFYLSLKESDDGETSASAELAYYRHISQSAADLNRVMMRTCTSLSSVEPFYLRSILLSIQNAWSDLKEHDKWAIYKELAYGCVVPSDVLYNKSRFPTIPLQSLDLIFDFVAQSLMPPKQLAGTTPADRYVTAIRQINENHYLYRCIAGMHQSIQRQILAQIARVNLESPIGRNEFGSLLLPLLSITKHRFLPLCYEELDDFVNVLLKVYKEDRDCIQETERDRTHLVGPQFHLPNYQETGRHLDLIAIFDEFIINRVDFSSQQKYSCLIETVIWLLTHWGEYLNLPAVSYCTRFKDIKDPCLALVSTKYHPEDKYSSNLLEPVEEPFIQTTLAESGIWKDGVDQMVFKAWEELNYDVVGSKLRTHLLQSTLIEGSWNARQGAMEVLERQEFNVCDDSKWRSFFSEGLFKSLLDYYTASNKCPNKFAFLLVMKYTWFYRIFKDVDGLQRLPRIILNHPSSGITMIQLLVDQTVFERDTTSLEAVLLCLYQCLESLGCTLIPLTTRDYEMGHMADLRDALLWVLHKLAEPTEETQSRLDSKVEEFRFIPSEFHMLRQYGWVPAKEPRSWDFIEMMETGKRQEWVARLKVMIMGAMLGGLKPGHYYGRTRFMRDPDGLCGSPC